MGLFDFLFGKNKQQTDTAANTPKQSAIPEEHVMPEKFRKLKAFRANSFKESEKAYAVYMEMVNSIDPSKALNNPVPPAALTNSETAFLKYLNGLPVKSPAIAQHWFYDEGFYYPHTVSKFLSQGYLTLSYLPNIEKLKVQDLKDVLQKLGLPAKGKKADLIDTILKNFSAEDYAVAFGASEQYYTLTSQGKAEVKKLQVSATTETELEDCCLPLIMESRFDDAINAINEHDSSIGRKRGISSSDYTILSARQWYKSFISSATAEDKLYRACFVLCDMLGYSNKTHFLIKRVTGDNFSKSLFDDVQSKYYSAAGYPEIVRSPKLDKTRAFPEPTDKDLMIAERLLHKIRWYSSKPRPEPSQDETEFVIKLVSVFSCNNLSPEKLEIYRLTSGLLRFSYPDGGYIAAASFKKGNCDVDYQINMNRMGNVSGTIGDVSPSIFKMVDYIFKEKKRMEKLYK